MKHLLPILTLALLGVATTASAEFYYDYYQNPGKTNFSNDYWVKDFDNVYETQADTFTYNNFSVARNSDWAWVGNENTYKNNTGKANIDNSNFYRIHVLGEEGSKVNLYLTDFVDNAGSDNNQSALYRNLSAYGYRTLTLVDGKYVPTGETKVFNLTGDDAVTPTVKDSVTIEKSYLDENNNTVDASYAVTRFQYSLGAFDPGTVIEVYMKDRAGGEAYSYAGFTEIDPTTNAPVGPQGGFGDGGYVVIEETDKMLNDYYYQDENLKAAATAAGMTPEKVAQIGFGTGWLNEQKRAAASAKSMPLSTLAPSGEGLYFGIFASAVTIIDDNQGGSGTGGGNGTFGNPLPGGLQFALIAGLFGLGFWYIRRRKATVA